MAVRVRSGELIARVIRTAADRVADTEHAALADEPDGVHQHRVSVRRLRSVLAGFRGTLDEPDLEPLRVLLGEWGRQLGTARDIEVLVLSSDAALDERGIDDETMHERLVDEEQAAYTRAHARVVELASLPRAQERARMLRALAVSPAVIDPDADARDVAAAVLRREAKRVRKAAKRRDGTEESLHELRKRGRRLRYVAEAIAEACPDLLGDEVDALADAGDTIHDQLGAHRDALAFADHVARAGVLAGRAGEQTAAYDDLEQDLRDSASGMLDGLDAVVKRVRKAADRLP